MGKMPMTLYRVIVREGQTTFLTFINNIPRCGQAGSDSER